MLPPASAAIFTHSLFHSMSAPGSRREGIRHQAIPAVPPDDVDARVLAIADGPGDWFGLTRRLAELLALFAQLTVAQTRALHARVWHPKSADPVAVALSGLGIDRKAALILFLGRHRAYR